MHYVLRFEGEIVKLAASPVRLGRADPVCEALRCRSVSRSHALLWRVGKGWWIKLLAASNSLEVNGSPVGLEGQRLSAGDRIELGSVVCWFEADPEATNPGEILSRPRPRRELLDRVERVELAIREILERLDHNEALDDRVRGQLERVAAELHASGERFVLLCKKINSCMVISLGAAALGAGAWVAVDVADAARRTQDFAAAIAEEAVEPSALGRLAFGVGAGVMWWRGRRRDEDDDEVNPANPAKSTKSVLPPLGYEEVEFVTEQLAKVNSNGHARRG